MEKNKSNWWIDLILFSIFWISFFPEFTGLDIHQWLGIAAMALAVWHLVKHWTWVETVTLRFFSRTSNQARMNYLVDAGVMGGFGMILITGLLISTWLNLPLYDLAAWTHVHLLVSVFTLLLVVLKLILHWRWIVNAGRRYILDPAFLRVGNTGLQRPVNPVDRRDFLKLTGILGVATAVTLHGLFDDTQAAQAQSVLPNQSEADTPQATAAAVSQTPVDAAAGSISSEAAATQASPTLEVPTSVPTTACVVLCPNGCSYPGRCRRYVDLNSNNLCDNGECL